MKDFNHDEFLLKNLLKASFLTRLHREMTRGKVSGRFRGIGYPIPQHIFQHRYWSPIPKKAAIPDTNTRYRYQPLEMTIKNNSFRISQQNRINWEIEIP